MFSRKHYLIIARVLRENDTREDIIKEFIRTLSIDNDAFKVERFKKALIK